MSHFRSQNSKQNPQATNLKHYQASDTREVYLYHHVNRWDTHKKNVDCKVGLCASLQTVAEFL